MVSQESELSNVFKFNCIHSRFIMLYLVYSIANMQSETVQ